MGARAISRRMAMVAAGAAALSAGRAGAQVRSRLLLLSGAPGGSFHDYGPALAKLLDGGAVELDVRPSGGSNENIRAVASGDADLGLINLGPAFDAWEGRRPFDKTGPARNLRALFPMYNTPFSLVALADSRIATLSDLAGRTVGVGPAGGPGQVFFKGLAGALGLGCTLATGSPNELARQVIAGEIAAFFFGAGVPVAAFVEVLEGADAVILGLTDNEIAAFRRVFAYMSPTTIPAGSYKGQTAPLKTASVWNFAIASDRMGDDVAYALTRTALGGGKALGAEVPSAAGTLPADVLADTFMPLHPGAARFYREAGIALPPALAGG